MIRSLLAELWGMIALGGAIVLLAVQALAHRRAILRLQGRVEAAERRNG